MTALQSKRVGVATACATLVVGVLTAGGFAGLPQAVQITALIVVGVLGVSLIVGDTVRPLGAETQPSGKVDYTKGMVTGELPDSSPFAMYDPGMTWSLIATAPVSSKMSDEDAAKGETGTGDGKADVNNWEP